MSDRFPQRLTFVTIGARDLPALRAFYKALGLHEVAGATETWTAFDMGHTKLALYPIELLRKEAAPSHPMIGRGTWNGVSLAVSVATTDEVAAVYEAALAAGGFPVVPPQKREWGGYSACFADPEGNRWEIAWAPGLAVPRIVRPGDHFAVLEEMEALRGAPPECVRWLAEHVIPMSFATGERLILEGATDRDCYFIVSGRVEVSSEGTVRGRSGPGDPEGEMALFFKRPRGGTATAITEVEALRLPAEDFDELSETDPAMAQAFMGAVMGHLSRRFAQPRDRQ